MTPKQERKKVGDFPVKTAHREALSAFRERLEAMIYTEAGGLDAARAYARFLDGMLQSVIKPTELGILPHTGLAALGGYGRNTLAPYADVDVLLVSDSVEHERLESWAHRVLYPLWDAGVPIDHAVRSVAETLALAETDIRTATTLFDLRYVLGDGPVVARLLEKGQEALYSRQAAVIEMLEIDVGARHERFGGSLYLLEPEVKLGRGGLRDYDTARWAARARWRASHWGELAEAGVLLSREVEELKCSHEFLWRIRNALHIRSGRRNDRLTFEDQEEISLALGYRDHVNLAVEQFMQHYYQHAQTIACTTDRLLARARSNRKSPSPPQALAAHVVLRDDVIDIPDLTQLQKDPSLALRLYVESVKHGRAPSIEVRDAIARLAADAEWSEKLRGQPLVADAFFTLLKYAGKAPVRRGSILGELLETGLMLAMIPEFDHVRGRVQHDVYHVYTVDVHSVAAVDRLSAMVRGEHAEDWPLASRLAALSPRPLPLRMALLLHDIGKGRGGHHADIGADMARRISERLGFQHGDVTHIEWLVREHLRMYHWALRRDITDPHTIEEAVNVVKNKERLRDLYLLTVADISTTSPSAMTSWKANMLQAFYFAVADGLSAAEPWSGQRRALALREELLRAAEGDETSGLATLVEAMPDRYILANSPATIEQHAQILEASGELRVHAGLVADPGAETEELVVVCHDQPGLLAAIAAALAGNRLDVTTAQIYTLEWDQRRLAFDIFHVRATRRMSARAVAELVADLNGLLEGTLTAQALLQKRTSSPTWAKRKEPDVPVAIHVSNQASGRFTVIDIFTKDHPGLLYAITNVFHKHGLSIALSKLSTEGNRVADVFYVQDLEGRKFEDLEKIASLDHDLRAILTDL
ncbi:MAG: [protein-PII] uridylyltransferase [Myxococcales bacterium]|nr:[protein-PII] uridylyltransferase [Myxococcales bacterium]